MTVFQTGCRLEVKNSPRQEKLYNLLNEGHEMLGRFSQERSKFAQVALIHVSGFLRFSIKHTRKRKRDKKKEKELERGGERERIG